MGSDEGAGDAWNVEPANAAASAGLGGAVCGGVWRACLVGAGDVEEVVVCCFDRDLLLLLLLLFPFRALGLAELLGCAADGTGLFEADFCGVNGPESSIGKSASLGMSLSEAYVLRAGELTGRFWRRRAGLFFGGSWCCSMVE